jgi:outer membrane murein-binding lipoprotein Lpp
MTNIDHSAHTATHDPLDDAGRLLLGLVRQAGSAARDNTEKAFDATRKLTAQIEAAEGRIKALERDVKRYRETAHRAKLRETLHGETELLARTDEMNALHRKLADVSALLTAAETEKHSVRGALLQKELEAAKLARLFLQFVECVGLLVRKIDTDKVAPDRPQDNALAYDWSRWDKSSVTEQRPSAHWTR